MINLDGADMYNICLYIASNISSTGYSGQVPKQLFIDTLR